MKTTTAKPGWRRTRRAIEFAGAVLVLSVPGLAIAESWQVEIEDWARPRTGEMVAGLPEVRSAVQAWLAAEDARLVIVYPGGESGQLWASEMRGWLVALGVEPDQLETHPGGEDDEVLELRLE